MASRLTSVPPALLRATLPPRRPGEAIVTPALAAFCTGGVSIVAGMAGPDGRALTGRALACVCDADGRMRLIFDAEGNDALALAAAAGGALAVTFSDPISHRSLQVKAPRSAAAVPSDTDIAEAGRQARAFAAVLRLIGYGDAFAEAYCRFSPADLRACTLLPDCLFEQTPGPGAGRAL